MYQTEGVPCLLNFISHPSIGSKLTIILYFPFKLTPVYFDPKNHLGTLVILCEALHTSLASLSVRAVWHIFVNWRVTVVVIL